MSESRSIGTQSGKRQRAAVDGAEEAGKGLQVTVPRNVPHAYNNNYTVRLTYADNFRHDIANNGSAAAVQVFRTDSIFDPDYTGTGHQPLFRDMWASQYDYYSVLSFDYEIRMFNAQYDNSTFTAVGTAGQRIGTVNVTTLPTTNVSDYVTSGTIYPIAEMKNAYTTWIPVEQELFLSGTLTPGDFIVDAKDEDSVATWTAVGSNPTVGKFFGYVITPTQWTSLVGISEASYSSIVVQVILNYTVQFTQVNQSLRSTSS